MAFREPNLMKEIADRTRRIETRMTKWLAEQGFETGGRKPEWIEDDQGVHIEAPNPAVSLSDCVEVIPEGRTLDYPVECGGFLLGFVSRP